MNPTIINTIAPMIVKKRPLFATLSTSSKFFSPRRREGRELIPTPVPITTENMRFWIGNASETAVSAFSEICATKMLSTIL